MRLHKTGLQEYRKPYVIARDLIVEKGDLDRLSRVSTDRLCGTSIDGLSRISKDKISRAS